MGDSGDLTISLCRSPKRLRCEFKCPKRLRLSSNIAGDISEPGTLSSHDGIGVIRGVYVTGPRHSGGVVGDV